MEKIANELLLPPLFFTVCFNSLLNLYYDRIDPDVLFLEYFEFLRDHLSHCPYSRFRLEKYSEKSYVLYPIEDKKLSNKDMSFLLLNGIENTRLRKGRGFVFPAFRLSQLQAFLLGMPHKKDIIVLSRQANDLMTVPVTTPVQSYLFDLSYYMNRPLFTAKACKDLLFKSIPDYYDLTFLLNDLSDFQGTSRHMLRVAEHFFFTPDQQIHVLTTRSKHDFYALVFSRQDVTKSQEYTGYKQQYDLNWMNSSLFVSEDRHVLYYSYSTFTGN